MPKVWLAFWLTLAGTSFAQAATDWHTDPFGPAQITTSDGFDIKGARVPSQACISWPPRIRRSATGWSSTASC